MLDSLTALPMVRTVAYQRKLYLLCCACCRRLGRQLTVGQKVRLATAERNADRWLAEDFDGKPFQFRHWGQHGTTLSAIRDAAVEEACANRGTCLCYAASAMALNVVPPDLSCRTTEYRAARTAEQAVQATLIRDLFGNPFRSLPTIDRSCLSWKDGLVVQLGRQIYRKRDFGNLPILADALEEAGCGSAEILLHCRRPGPHARGCWILDLLLDRAACGNAKAYG